MKDRDPKYDIMKGLGIILVALGHCGMALGHYMIYMFHMPLFFYVSGRLHKDKPVIKGIKSKFTSLAVPYVIFFVLCALIDYFLFIDDPEYKINPLSPMNSGGPLWFLFAMLWVYILFLILNKYIPQYALIVCIALSVASYYLSITDIRLPLYIDSAASCLIFYAIGHYSRNVSFRFGNKVYLFIPIVLAFMLYGLYIIDFSILHLSINDLYTNNIMENYSLFIISAIVGIIFIESLSKILVDIKFDRIKMILCRLGELSLYIFALHLMIINIIRYNIDAEGNLYYLLAAVISLAVSAGIGLLMEKHINTLIRTLNSKW